MTTPLRVLIAVHGYEPAGWAEQTCRIVSTWAAPSVRLLGVLDVPGAPFTSLTGPARRMRAAARAQWTRIERERLAAPIAALRPGLPAQTDVSCAEGIRGDLALAIAEHAHAWPADVVVVGPPARRLGAWLRPGPVHRRVVRLARCAVLVVAPPAGVPRRARRPVATPHPAHGAMEQRA